MPLHRLNIDHDRLAREGGTSIDWDISRFRVCYARSDDGITWEKPPTGVVGEDGHDTNIVFGDESYGNVWGLTLLDDPLETDPARRYKGLVGHPGVGGLCPAISADGMEWQRLDVPAVPSGDESQFTYDPYGEQFIAMVKHGTDWGRSVFLATSPDGEHYSDQELIFHTDETDWENCRQRVRAYLDDPG